MAKIENIIHISKNPLTVPFLMLEIREAVRDSNTALAYSIKLAVKNNEPAINIIEMLQSYINDVGSACAMTELLGVELCEKIKNF